MILITKLVSDMRSHNEKPKGELTKYDCEWVQQKKKKIYCTSLLSALISLYINGDIVFICLASGRKKNSEYAPIIMGQFQA